ncbi:hypothetical protein [Streptomyces sp. R44]|uniref:Uncharacterized protein n=1 Tax=Streptomyces sp. R44 TaxID=3238633 RepID=A0AB39SWZ4_9ACTN
MRGHDEYDRPEQAGGGSDAPPVYPGESTAIDGGGTDTGTETRSGAGAGAGAGADAGAGAGVGTDTDTDTDTGTDTDTARDTGDGTAAGTERAEGAGAEDEAPRLLDPDDEETFRSRWHEIQSRFVDDPRDAVHEADALVTDVISKLADTFADRKKDLEGQWSEGEDVDTENLRMALRQYRSFFHRLLTT